MSTSTDLVVERTVDLVLLCSENGGEIIGHVGSLKCAGIESRRRTKAVFANVEKIRGVRRSSSRQVRYQIILIPRGLCR